MQHQALDVKTHIYFIAASDTKLRTTTQYFYSVDSDMHLSNTQRMQCCFSTQQQLCECDTMVHSMYNAYLQYYTSIFVYILFCSGLPAKFQKGTWSLQINTEQEIVKHNFKISLLVVVDKRNISNY